MSGATIPSYKWWEINDKTKRLYTDMLAEKLSSPRKSSDSLRYKPPNSGIKKSPANDTTVYTHVGFKSKSGGECFATASVENQTEQLEKKYVFETITIDTLAKYDYIKSPRKTPNEGLSDTPDTKQNAELQEDLMTMSPAKQTRSTYDGTNGHFLLSKKLSAPTKMEASACESKVGNKSVLTGLKEKPPKAKLLQAAEYDFVIKSGKEKEGNVSPWCKKVSYSDDESYGPAHKETDIDLNELTKKYQTLCDQVEQIEMELSEFSDGVQMITVNMGFKESKYETLEGLKSGKDVTSVRKPSCSSFRKKYGLGTTLDPKTSPSKVFRSLLPVYEDLTLPEVKSKEELDAEIMKIKQGHLTEDEIQEILRCAKAKYIDNPNYLEDVGCEFKPEARKND